VIGIAQNNLRAQILENVLWDGLHRSSRADWHEGRRFNIAVGGADAGLAGRAGLGLDSEGQSHIEYGTRRKFSRQPDSPRGLFPSC